MRCLSVGLIHLPYHPVREETLKGHLFLLDLWSWKRRCPAVSSAEKNASSIGVRSVPIGSFRGINTWQGVLSTVSLSAIKIGTLRVNLHITVLGGIKQLANFDVTI
jgi:hypothetical protein